MITDITFSRGAYYYVLLIIYLGQEAYSSRATCGSFEGPIWLADKI